MVNSSAGRKTSLSTSIDYRVITNSCSQLISYCILQRQQCVLSPHFIHVPPVGWLVTVVSCVMFRSRTFHSCGDVTIAGEGLQYLGLCLAPWAFGFFRSHPKNRPIKSPLTTRKGILRTHSNPYPHGSHIWSPCFPSSTVCVLFWGVVKLITFHYFHLFSRTKVCIVLCIVLSNTTLLYGIQNFRRNERSPAR
jgi:hypothetical protein